MPHKHLTLSERIVIERMINNVSYVKDIALALGRPVSTIYREIQRNSGTKEEGYVAKKAHRMALKRKFIRKPYVITGWVEKLIQHWMIHRRLSPSIMSYLLARKGIEISHEAIYQYVYRDARAGGTLYQSMIRQRRRRRSHLKRRANIDRLKQAVKRHFTERNKTDEYGHFEADLIHGSTKDSLLVITELKTAYNHIIHLPNRTAKVVTEAICKTIQKESLKHRLSLTMDNGVEFLRWEEIEKRTKIQCYFTDIKAPWQRALNENRNGLIRSMGYPKGSSFADVTGEKLDKLCRLVNHRPMKKFGFKSPAHIRQQLI